MKEKIVIVDDEKDILELLDVNLKKNGFNTILFQNGSDFLNYFYKNSLDLVILDLMLPDIDGLEILRKIKEKDSLMPVIILTAKGEEFDRVIGLEIGADDYIVKPFSIRELIARVKTILRRVKTKNLFKENLIEIDENFKIYPNRYEVFIKDKKINLTITEFKILLLLIQKRGEVISRDDMLNYLWGIDKIVIDRTIDVHIKNLREKLGDYKFLIKNIRGVGYKIEI